MVVPYKNWSNKAKFESPQQKAYINLYYTYYHFHNLHSQLLKPYDILPQHYNILKIVKGNTRNQWLQATSLM